MTNDAPKSRRIDMAGQKVERLTFVSYSHDSPSGKPMWRCVCECGNAVTVCAAAVRAGHTKACGCLKNAARSGSGESHPEKRVSSTRIYKLWAGMIARCSNPNHKWYHRYGGRGITVCREWLEFEGFYRDMGDKPFEGASIDRIDPDGGYSASNCRWASAYEQNRNTAKHKNGLAGVHYLARTGRYLAQLSYKHKTINLGRHASQWDAICARKSAENIYWRYT